MPWVPVDKYWLGYSVKKKQFYFYYQLSGDATIHQLFPTPEEFLGLSDMFRYEGPIQYSTDNEYFTTTAEAVGEGE